HARGLERSRRDSRPDIGDVVHDVCKPFHVGALATKFLEYVEHAGLRKQQMRFNRAQRAQVFQQADAVDRAGGAGNGDDEPARCRIAQASCACLSRSCNSPFWYISVRMSAPPTNWPLT